MKRTGPNSMQLRQEAEAQLARAPDTKVQPHPADELLHELHVHQIELEMQNETLRQAQIALEESRDRYLDLYDFAPVGYLTLTDAGLISETNFTGAALLGVERTKLLQRRFAQFIVAEDRDSWYHFCSQVLHQRESGENHNCELRLTRSDGTDFTAYLDCRYMKSDSGEPTMRVTLADVSHMRKAEEAMCEWQTFVENATWGMTIGDMESRTIRLANPAYARMHGYRVEELCNLKADVMYAPDSRASLSYYVECLRKDKHVTFECERLRKDGSTFPAIVDISIVDGIDGKTTTMVTVRDITERMKLENELRESNQLLRKLSEKTEKLREEERKRIAREVHDELGQILTALRMDVALISLRFGDQNAELLAKTEGMSALLDQAGWCVRDIVSNLRPTALDMGIVAAVRWLCSEYATHTGSACVLHTDEESIELDEDRAVAVFRIVQELLTNAARHAEASNVKITLARHGDDLHIQVRDDGKGFDLAVAASKKSYGLLGISERAIALGGNIEIVSAPDQGTSVFIRVPARPKRSSK